MCYIIDSSLSSGVLRMDIYSSGGLLLGINEYLSGERYLFASLVISFFFNALLPQHIEKNQLQIVVSGLIYEHVFIYFKKHMKKSIPDPSDEMCRIRLIHADRIATARKKALADEENVRLCELFKAMGDATRLKILMALAEGEMCVCDLAAYLDITESAVSHQLRLLRQIHLVANRRQGPVIYYRLDDDHVSELVRLALQHIRE